MRAPPLVPSNFGPYGGPDLLTGAPALGGRAPSAGVLRHDPRMNRDTVLALLREHLPVLRERFGVRGLRLFGSMARDTAREDSDIDVLVAFDRPPDSDQFFGTQFYLEDLLGRSIDLVTETALRERLRPYVERDAIPV
jgi:hypothetical protein